MQNVSPFAALPASAECADQPLVLTYSDFARACVHANPSLLDAIRGERRDRDAMTARLSILRDEAEQRGTAPEHALNEAMRVLKREVQLHAAETDLTGQARLADVTGAMTTLAELCLQACCDFHYARLGVEHGMPRADGVAQPFLVIGMGKLGGRELNVSSDIDLIFAYPEGGETDGAKPLSNQEFFARLGRAAIGAMSEITPHGYVFRVDMRLRPNGDAGALASSFAALETYFVVQGREWERYAWIKARVVASTGDTGMCTRAIDELEALRLPFVFRKYLDFGAIAAIRDLHAQIRAEAQRRAATRASHATPGTIDIKLGRGGIREIEFTAQVFQLIRGGRMRKLQARPTCEVLRHLADEDMLSREVVKALIDAYEFLRALEHRLQYVDDAQTHRVPPPGPLRDRIARMMGLADGAALDAALSQVQDVVEQAFEDVIEATPAEASFGGRLDWFGDALRESTGLDAAREALAQRGFVEVEVLVARLAALVGGRRWTALSQVARDRLTALIDPVLTFASKTTAPEIAAARFIDLLDAIATRSAYLALLLEYPQALERVGRMLAVSPWAATYLTRHPILLDELLDERELRAKADWAYVRHELDATLAEATLPGGVPDIERRMDILRETHHVQSFRLLAQDLDGLLSVEALADELSALADLSIDAALRQAWAQLNNRHRDEPRFAVIAYGKLGGKELGYASDLDLVFVYDDDHERAPEMYAKLAQRLISWLTAHTAAGRLFEVDMRLRPNGNAGLLVTSLASFERYQMQRGSNAAWVWEHQALTRARACAGHAPTGERFEEIRRAVLGEVRESAHLLPEVAAMRVRMRDGHPNPTGLFDIKHDTGGMVDIEFIVQALVLLHAAQWPDLAENKGNIALLLRAAAHGLLPITLAQECADAYRVYRARQHAARLQAEGDAGPTRVPPEEFVAQREAVHAAWAHVFGSLSHD
ncbi:MAG TPA: bifunctional [glutamate--ammonia ligase]-adenylyl-L-tyrosine phosphorylase/[glutamate--ammonia-ligase] adenylyltransferase [Burkholderiaceae bacterium]|nr:bifunctional [glutamate--ammonia ligase]-adenylyl-L-tyrosine phosphorylase/[glutamate--ammonia-ligase] adenylyltransferase [Burkholderiaceae bacterium]